MRNPAGSWTDITHGLFTIIVGRSGQPQLNSKDPGFKSICKPVMGNPSVANCLAAAGKFHQTDPLEKKTNRWSKNQNCVELRNRDRFLGKNTYKLGLSQRGYILPFGAVFRQLSCAKGPRYYNPRCIQWGKFRKSYSYV